MPKISQSSSIEKNCRTSVACPNMWGNIMANKIFYKQNHKEIYEKEKRNLATK